MALALAIEKIQISQLLFSVDFLIPSIGVTVYRHQSVRFRVGKRLEQHSADQAEHHRGRSDAERQCQQCNSDKAGPLAEAAHGIANVLPKIEKPAPAPHVSRYLLRHSHVSEFAAGGMASLLLRDARLHGIALC